MELLTEKLPFETHTCIGLQPYHHVGFLADFDALLTLDLQFHTQNDNPVLHRNHVDDIFHHRKELFSQARLPVP